MKKFTITLAQINVQPDQVEKNVEKLESIIHQLSANGLIDPPHLILLPELWSTGFTPNLESAVKQNDEILQTLFQFSSQFNLILGGSYISHTEHHDYTNEFKLILPNSPLIPTYKKIHLFSQMNEVNWFQPGDQPAIVEYHHHRLGLSICYDLRFPNLFLNYGIHQVELCLLPAQWPTKRIDHFTKLIQARAIENQFFFAAVNTVGSIGNTSFGGNSMLVDPKGQPLITLAALEDDIQTISIDLSLVAEQRKAFPV
jgi:predicted amidohydrolase